ncbi:hypothetical protein B0H13DRAFT_1871782 [Mycena leptocephala]|nr:hypothetical protein B0H13DRAFT_1918527 [Mycena leptocephala]KAJ7915780.1 hypothetical protein B0H13DRAFT_1871782 [Mycena leptocephala]
MPSHPLPQIYCCCPLYAPEQGHEDRWKHRGDFFVVDDMRWKGVVTSAFIGSPRATFARLQEIFPDAKTFQVASWKRVNQVWEINCKENHDHTFDRPRTPTPDILPETPESSLPSSPSTLTATTVSRPPSPSLTLPPRTPLRDRAKDLKFLGDFRPPAVHLSPQRATQLFTRVLGAHSVLNPVPLPIEPIMPPQTEDKRASSSKQVEIQEPLAGEETKGLIFAVAGNTRLFKERQRAMVVFRRTPNAELFYNNDEDLVWVFLGEAQLLEEYPNSLLYAVRGHNRIFAERQRAMDVFRRTPNAEMYFSSCEDQVWAFLAEDPFY